MIEVAICICTRNRNEGLKKLLRSISEMKVPSGTSIRIIVVENNQESLSKSVVDGIISECELDILYSLETKQGISQARNKTVEVAGDVDYCCFVDDDQTVDKHWLEELMKCQKEFNADAVWGPNPPVFKTKVSQHISRFHQPELYDYGARVKQAYTNCLLIKKERLNKFDGPFDIRLNFTGGEDSYLTNQITKSDGTIRYTPYAKAYEHVPEERCSNRYILKRTFRTANTKLIVNSLLNESKSESHRFYRLLLRLGFGLLTCIPYYIFSKSGKLTGMIKVADALGGISFYIGAKNRFYKHN